MIPERLKELQFSLFFAHFYNELIGRGAEVGIGRIWLVTGGLGVELFFFLIGYGLNMSNGIMGRDFLRKRAKGVVLSLVIIQAVLYLISLSRGERVSVFSFGLSTLSSTWFVSIILIIYIGYYICYKLFSRKYLNRTMLVYNVIIGITFMILGFDQRWYNGHLLFSLGMYMADYNEWVTGLVAGKKWWIKFTGGMISFWYVLSYSCTIEALCGQIYLRYWQERLCVFCILCYGALQIEFQNATVGRKEFSADLFDSCRSFEQITARCEYSLCGHISNWYCCDACRGCSV